MSDEEILADPESVRQGVVRAIPRIRSNGEVLGYCSCRMEKAGLVTSSLRL